MKLTNIDEILSGISVQFMEKTAQSLPVAIIRERLLRGLEKSSEVSVKRAPYTYDVRDPNTYATSLMGKWRGLPSATKAPTLEKTHVTEADKATKSLNLARSATKAGPGTPPTQKLHKVVADRQVARDLRFDRRQDVQPFSSVRSAYIKGTFGHIPFSNKPPSGVAATRVQPRNSGG